MDPDFLMDALDWADDTTMDTVLTGLGILFFCGYMMIEGLFIWDRRQQRKGRQ